MGAGACVCERRVGKQWEDAEIRHTTTEKRSGQRTYGINPATTLEHWLRKAVVKHKHCSFIGKK